MRYRIKIANKSRDFGETDFQKGVIKINKKKSRLKGKRKGTPEVLDTIKHETLHADNPKLSERAVRKKTKSFIKKASKKQKSKTYNLANNQYYVAK